MCGVSRCVSLPSVQCIRRTYSNLFAQEKTRERDASEVISRAGSPHSDRRSQRHDSAKPASTREEGEQAFPKMLNWDMKREAEERLPTGPSSQTRSSREHSDRRNPTDPHRASSSSSHAKRERDRDDADDRRRSSRYRDRSKVHSFTLHMNLSSAIIGSRRRAAGSPRG
jgi:hypothetical protein